MTYQQLFDSVQFFRSDTPDGHHTHIKARLVVEVRGPVMSDLLKRHPELLERVQSDLRRTLMRGIFEPKRAEVVAALNELRSELFWAYRDQPSHVQQAVKTLEDAIKRMPNIE